MDTIEGLGSDPTDQELNDELVFTRILVETLDPDAFDYDTDLARYTAKIEQIESRLGIEPNEASQSQMASQEPWNDEVTTPVEANGGFEELLSPVANYNAINGVGAGATGE